MKKYLSLLLAGIPIMMLIGCGDTATSPDENGGAVVIEKIDSSSDEEVQNEEPADNEMSAEEPVQEAEPDSDASFYGTWQVKACQPAEVYALSEEEIEAFLNYTITYQADAVLVNDQNMNIATSSYKEQGAYTEEKFVEEYQTNVGEWWNEKSQVLRVDITSDESFFGDQFFVADEGTIWIYYEGVTFLARKQ